MKRGLKIFILLMSSLPVTYAQETLRTVTDRGSATSNRISINPIYQIGSRLTAYGAGSGYFDLYNNSNSSISLALKRSDGASVFEIDGHSMNSYFGGNVGIGTQSSIWALTVNGTITSNGNGDQRFHLRPNAGFSGCVYWAESGIAERGILGFNAGSGDLVYRSGAYDFLTGSERFRITENGNVGIGTSDPKGYKLAVNGNIRAKEIKVEAYPWPDYVFTKEYQLPTLQETEKYIKDKGHLLGIPSAAEVEAKGINLGEMNAKLLQKIEELTLHLIEQNKAIESLTSENKKQQNDIQFLKSRVE